MNTSASVHTFAWLVKREYWEHRGGFFWTPLIIGMVMIAITLMMLVSAEVTSMQHGVHLSGLNLNQLAEHLSGEDLAKFAAGVDLSLLSLSAPIAIALSFVTFFYLLGALYDDRRDRSVLFWKSLPISDVSTVLSKVAAAVIVAPVIALAGAITLQLAFLVVTSLYAALHGVNPFPLLWSPAHLIALWIKLALLIPVNAIWALPAVGWLLLCSAFARSKPFLWAVMLPIIVGVIVVWVNLMQQFALPSTWYWKNVVARILLSVVPAGWLSIAPRDAFVIGNNPADISGLLSFARIGDALAAPNLWIGAVAGCVMIVAAIYFRRKRTESYA